MAVYKPYDIASMMQACNSTARPRIITLPYYQHESQMHETICTKHKHGASNPIITRKLPKDYAVVAQKFWTTELRSLQTQWTPQPPNIHKTNLSTIIACEYHIFIHPKMRLQYHGMLLSAAFCGCRDCDAEDEKGTMPGNSPVCSYPSRLPGGALVPTSRVS